MKSVNAYVHSIISEDRKYIESVLIARKIYVAYQLHAVFVKSIYKRPEAFHASEGILHRKSQSIACKAPVIYPVIFRCRQNRSFFLWYLLKSSLFKALIELIKRH